MSTRLTLSSSSYLPALLSLVLPLPKLSERIWKSCGLRLSNSFCYISRLRSLQLLKENACFITALRFELVLQLKLYQWIDFCSSLILG
jgi:hypothetical protein